MKNGKTADNDNGLIKMALLAVGGQGGGVLNTWIVQLAERGGYDVQATSIAGVAQRTGSTVYYIEMMPKSGRLPVFALSAVEGDVDIVVAMEMMEAGRAITRGFVTADHTKMIVSTHRQLATMEKVVPGDGTADQDRIMDAIAKLVDRPVAFDMDAIAEEEGSVISASMLGAIAGSGYLPFKIGDYREVIKASGRGAESSLAAFERAARIASGKEKIKTQTAAHKSGKTGGEKITGPEKQRLAYERLAERAGKLPKASREMALAGLRKVVDFQDTAYGDEYIETLENLAEADSNAGGKEKDFAFTTAAAKHLANAMAYDDIIRVADAKTRPGRLERIATENRATDSNTVQITEYTHPGASEVVSIMPTAIGSRIMASRKVMSFIDRLVNRGRHIRTDRIGGFTMMYILAGLRPWRRRLLRHREEMNHITNWLETCRARLDEDYGFAVETVNCRRLIKGYSDTHARGLGRFDRVMEGSRMVAGRKDASHWMRILIKSALADHKQTELDGALKTIRSFSDDSPAAPATR